MRLDIKVVPGAARNMLKEDNGVMKVYLTAAPVEGKANQALIKFLAEHFQVRKSAVAIIKGEKSRKKSVIIST